VKPVIFLDTGAIYAIVDRDDAHHRAISAIYRDVERRFLTHELVLVEAFSLITKRVHKEAAIRMIGSARRSPRIECAPITPTLLEAGWQRCARFADKEWDWVDCCSFEVMEERGLREALAVDRHFTQAGFSVLP
jgi:uncharacterized protein